MKVLKLASVLLVIATLLPLGVQAADPTTDIDAAGRDQRIVVYKADYPVKLTDKEKTKLTTTCAAAQENIQKIFKRSEGITSERSTVYATVDNRLGAVQKRLSTQQLDTSVIDLLHANYRKQTTAFSAALTTYRQTLQDSSTMDCKADLSGFRSSVEAVRVARKSVADKSLSIHELVRVDAKTSFDTIKKRLDEGTK